MSPSKAMKFRTSLTASAPVTPKIFYTDMLIQLFRTLSLMSTAVNRFEARLDRFWANQDVKYDFTADLTGVGDRSVYEICEM